MKCGQSISAVIPVKGKSSRLPNKNILPFADSNLLIHKIRQLRQIPELDEIIVSSDSEEMLEMGRSEGVTAVRRPKQFADESQPFGFFLEYICTVIQGENLMWACCTSPMVSSALYRKAISTYFEQLQQGYDSLITVQKYQHFLLDNNGPMNFKRGLNHVNSQDLPIYYYFTNGIVLSPKESVWNWKYHFGPNVYKLEVEQNEAVDIDTYYDYVTARAYYEDAQKAKDKFI